MVARAHSRDGSQERSIERLAEIGRFPNDWDGEGAVRPAARTLDLAADFVQALSPRLPRPAIGAAPDGSVEFEWEPGSRKPAVAVTFGSDGRIALSAFTAAAVLAEEETEDAFEAARFVSSFLSGTHAGGR